MLRHAVDFHREQAHPDSCLAASVSILQAWIGREPVEDEPTLLARWPVPKTDTSHAAELGKQYTWDPSDPRDLDRLRAALARTWLLATLFPGPLTYFTTRRRPVPVSRHGRLLPYEQPRYAQGLPHAVVLVEALQPEGIRYLDPYYPNADQPFSLTDDEFLETWTGFLVIPDMQR